MSKISGRRYNFDQEQDWQEPRQVLQKTWYQEADWIQAGKSFVKGGTTAETNSVEEEPGKNAT